MFTEEAKKTDAEIKNRIEFMRAERKKPYEVTKEYLRIENRNIVNFRQKIECLP
jgi:adenosyl cobinamide kinase/adenosyl cobinamide phosphate guanylyltransferase